MQSGSSDFGLNVSKRRVEKGLSQEKLGELAGISTNTIQRIEAGQVTKTDKVLPLCEALGTSPNELFGVTNDLLPGLMPELVKAVNNIIETGRKTDPKHQKELARMLEFLTSDIGEK